MLAFLFVLLRLFLFLFLTYFFTLSILPHQSSIFYTPCLLLLLYPLFISNRYFYFISIIILLRYFSGFLETIVFGCIWSFWDWFLFYFSILSCFNFSLSLLSHLSLLNWFKFLNTPLKLFLFLPCLCLFFESISS